MASISSKQTGQAIITAGNLTVTAAITAVNLSRSVIICSVRANPANNTNFAGRVTCTAIFNSTTQIQFERQSSNNSCIIEYQVIEFDSSVVVQTFNGTLSATGTTNISLTAVNLSNTFVIAYGQNSGGDMSGGFCFRAEITSTTNLELKNDGSTTKYSCFVVESTDFSVQKVTGTMTKADADGIADNTITGVNTAQTFTFGTFRFTNGAGSELYNFIPQHFLQSSTNLRVLRDGVSTGLYDCDYCIYVISSADVTIQRGSKTVSSTSDNQTITAVNSSDTFVKHNGQNNAFSYNDSTGTRDADDCCISCRLTSSTNLNFEKENSSSIVTIVYYEVVEFNGTAPGGRVYDFSPFFMEYIA